MDGGPFLPAPSSWSITQARKSNSLSIDPLPFPSLPFLSLLQSPATRRIHIPPRYTTRSCHQHDETVLEGDHLVSTHRYSSPTSDCCGVCGPWSSGLTATTRLSTAQTAVATPHVDLEYPSSVPTFTVNPTQLSSSSTPLPWFSAFGREDNEAPLPNAIDPKYSDPAYYASSNAYGRNGRNSSHTAKKPAGHIKRPPNCFLLFRYARLHTLNCDLDWGQGLTFDPVYVCRMCSRSHI